LSHNRRRLCQTFLNYTQNHEKISSVIARIYRPDVCLFKRRSRSAGWIAYPDSPEGREAVTIPDEFLRTYLLKYFDFDRNGELSRYEASLVVRIDCPGNINAGEGAYMCDATGIEACTNLRYESVGKRPDQTRCKQQQTARYARLFNQYSSEKFGRVAKQESLATALLCLFS
jgi:hypothetical protein